jgi:hypothetical protein
MVPDQRPTFSPTDYSRDTAVIAPSIWTATLSPQQDTQLTIADIQKSLKTATVTTKAPISAFLTLTEGHVTKMSLVRDPARVMEPRVASAEDCVGIKEYFVGQGWKVEGTHATNNSDMPKLQIRACLGLREGYGKDGELHSILEAEALLKYDPDIKVTPTHLVSIRYDAENVYEYEAGAVVVERAMEPECDGSVVIEKLGKVASSFGQNRFFYEDYESGETVALAKAKKD